MESRGVALAGAETVAFERIEPSLEAATLPAHRRLLVDSGIYIVEMMNLCELMTDCRTEFTLILAPLKIRGATGAPVRPLALCRAGSRF